MYKKFKKRLVILIVTIIILALGLGLGLGLGLKKTYTYDPFEIKEGMGKYKLDHLTQDKSQKVSGPIQDTEELPKNIFLLWLQGWDNIPWLQQKVKLSWEINNPGWNIILLDESNLKNYVNDIDYIYDKSKNITYQAKSDIIRLSLLKNIGGVWADSTMLCMQPLDHWVHNKVNPVGMWMYHGRGSGMDSSIGPASWFLISKKNNYILSEWKKKCDDFWKTNPVVNNNYFWMDGLFKKLYYSDNKFKELWSKVPFISCLEKGSSHTLADFGMDRNDEELKHIFKTSPPYALKFWNKWHNLFDGNFDSKKCKESNGGYAIELSTTL